MQQEIQKKVILIKIADGLLISGPELLKLDKCKSPGKRVLFRNLDKDDLVKIIILLVANARSDIYIYRYI